MYLLASNASSGMFAAGMLIIIFLLLRRSRRYLGKTKKKAPTEPRRKLDDARKATPLLDAPPEILRWHVEMHETTRELKAELDSKMGALQALTRIAGEEAARLEDAISRAEQLGISPCPDVLAGIEELNGGDGLEGVLETIESLPQSDDLSARRDVVYQLADQGLAAYAIARSIGAPLGDVELLMSLRTESRP